MSLSAASKVLGVPINPEEEGRIIHQDGLLLQELYEKCSQGQRFASSSTGLVFFNEEVSMYARKRYDRNALTALEDFLSRKGVTDIPIVEGFELKLNGRAREVAVIAATDISAKKYHGEMSSMIYLRDHIQVAAALMELFLTDSQRYAKEGASARRLYISALDLLSTPAQLQRFSDVIRRGKQADQEAWPHISLWFDDLEGERANGWRNIQDSFQMLAYHTLDALERGFLTVSELTPAHKTFLGRVVPLLKAVGFPHYESSGSWEEVAARRTSVIAVETALLHKYYTLAGHDFLPDTAIVKELLYQGLHELGNRLPGESEDYDVADIRYREADAALVYVVLYDLPQLLERFAIPIRGKGILSADAIEELVLGRLARLDDVRTMGMLRYEGDSYQGLNFHTEETQWIVGAIKQKIQRDALSQHRPPDYAAKQQLRGELTPSGYEAAWTHPLGQLASWAAKKSLQSGAPDRYRLYAGQWLNRALTLITGEEQWHVVREKDAYAVRQAPGYRLPECYVAYRQEGRGVIVVPSPHTPLNWSSVMLRLAVGLLRSGS